MRKRMGLDLFDDLDEFENVVSAVPGLSLSTGEKTVSALHSGSAIPWGSLHWVDFRLRYQLKPFIHCSTCLLLP